MGDDITIDAKHVDLEAVDANHLAKVAKELGIDGDLTVKELVAKVCKKLKAQAEKTKDDLAQCTECSGVFPNSYDACPYCGDKEGAADDADSGDNEEEDDDSDSDSGEDEGDDDSDEAADSGDQEEDEPMETATESTKDKGKKRVKTGSGDAKKNGKALAKVEPAPTALGKFSEKDLDAAVTAVQHAKAEGAIAYWKLGQRIAHIYKNNLFKLRTDDGKVKYKGFEAFCQAELGMTHSNAYDLMDVANRFTEKDVAQFGTTKLALLLKAPESTQEEIKGKIAGGASTKDVKAAVRQARAEKGKPAKSGRKRSDKSGARAKKPATSGTKTDRITVAASTSRITVPLYTKETAKKKEPLAAKKLEQEPTGETVMLNGVVMHISIARDNDGALRALVNFKRVD